MKTSEHITVTKQKHSNYGQELCLRRNQEEAAFLLSLLVLHGIVDQFPVYENQKHMI